MSKKIYHTVLLLSVLYLASCSVGRNFTTEYYKNNKEALNSIRERFKNSYAKKPFHVQFKDKTFRYISYEIITDSLRYIYNFDLGEPFLADTLDKYGYDKKEIIGLIVDMRAIKCTWISSLAYFEGLQKKSMIFISARDHRLQSLVNGEKYYALAFFNEPQFFDEKGRLTDKSEKKRLREINGAVFHRITDRVCYAITGTFR
jgi:hypothetical protein